MLWDESIDIQFVEFFRNYLFSDFFWQASPGMVYGGEREDKRERSEEDWSLQGFNVDVITKIITNNSELTTLSS